MVLLFNTVERLSLKFNTYYLPTITDIGFPLYDETIQLILLYLYRTGRFGGYVSTRRLHKRIL